MYIFYRFDIYINVHTYSISETINVQNLYVIVPLIVSDTVCTKVHTCMILYARYKYYLYDDMGGVQEKDKARTPHIYLATGFIIEHNNYF
jgi:hypothetical protein